MDRQAFEVELQSQGYQVITTVSQPAGYAMGEHAHPFDACALITEGDFTITVQGQARHYQKGEVFRLPAGTVHGEHAGPQGVTYLAGRRTKETS
jgi:quercetin dioxygenase-like cupin family protein